MSWPTESIVIYCSDPSSTTFFNVTPSANIRWTYSTRSIEGCGLRSHILDRFGYRVSVEVLQRDIAKSNLSLLGSCKSSLTTDCEEQRSAVECPLWLLATFGYMVFTEIMLITLSWRRCMPPRNTSSFHWSPTPVMLRSNSTFSPNFKQFWTRNNIITIEENISKIPWQIMRSSALSRPKFPLRSPVAFSHTYPPPQKKAKKKTGQTVNVLKSRYVCMYVCMNIWYV
jgi:hypothetical protein